MLHAAFGGLVKIIFHVNILYMKFLMKLIKFLNKPGLEKIKIIKLKVRMFSAYFFYFGKVNLPFTFLAYQPDSHSQFNLHEEFHKLYKSFISYNKFNNAGDVTRLWSFILNIKQILNEKIDGDFAEVGVWRGNSASVLAYYAASAGRKVYLFDTFEGFDSRDLSGIDNNKQMAFSDTSLSMVKKVIGEFEKSCVFIKGYFPSSVTEECKVSKYSVVSLDCDLCEPMKEGLEFFYPRMNNGGLFLLHDYSSNHWDGAKKAIDDFCAINNERVVLMPDKSGSAFIRKSRD